jgi:hypothetical protein
MAKIKQIYRSEIHNRDKSHDVCIIQDQSKVRGVKLKMTYESYNALERFTGEQWVGGKWEHTFSMLDLGVTPDSSSYVWGNSKRLKRTEDLIMKGIEYFNIINQ